MDTIVTFLLDSLPGTELVLLALLPRGVRSWTLPSRFTAGHDSLNAHYKCGQAQAANLVQRILHL